MTAHVDSLLAPTIKATPSSAPDAPGLAQSALGTEKLVLGKLLGKGGMGQVIECRDAQLDRSLALKVAFSRKPEDLERFVREARVQGQLQHPSIVPVHQLAEATDGTPFFTMKRVQGVTLHDAVELHRRGEPEAQKFPRRRLLNAFQQVVLAVEYAHAHGVLHRDLKPANVMMGEFGEVYVLDWGLAKKLDGGDSSGEHPAVGTADPSQWPGSANGSTPTVAGSLLGTPGYMAPEQVTGGAASVQSDVFALGSILFELLTLQRLVPGATVPEVLVRTRDGFDARPLKRAPAAEIAPELDLVVAKACAMKAEERFGSARELHEAVERVLAGERDHELRGQMADAHASKAAELATNALEMHGDTLPMRKDAMQQIGRALVLEPNHPKALETMMRLLSTPPRQTPPEVAAEIEAQVLKGTRTAARVGAIGYGMLFLFMPMLVWMGVRDWTHVAVHYGLLIAAVGACTWVARNPKVNPTYALLGLLFSGAMIASVSMVMSPFLIVPAFAVANTVAFVLFLRRNMRWFAVLFGLASVLIPVALWGLGLMPAPIRFTGEGMLIVPLMVDLNPVPTLTVLIVSFVSTIVIAGFAVGRMRDSLAEAEERMVFHTWNLKQLLPASAQGASSRLPPKELEACGVMGILHGSS